jgi:4-carboxymuconolactone decarboxylase
MRITETARNNHEELFPNRTSTLMVTDPELIEVFDNFAFDEVLAYGHLETRTRLMVILASLIASQALNEVFTERGVQLPLPGQSTTTPDTRAKSGQEVQKHIVGDDVVGQLYASAPTDQQHIQRFLAANCFGDHLTRAGIDLPTRELITLSMLVALGGCNPQVKAMSATTAQN